MQTRSPMDLRLAPLVARGEHRDICAVFGCGLHWQETRLAESGFTIGYCYPHLAQAERVFGQGKTKAAA